VAKALWVRPLADAARRQLRLGPTRLPAERPHAPAHWAEEEFGGLQVWDARLIQRLYPLAEDFWGDAQSRSLTRRGAERARTVAAYRFFRNPRINMQVVLGAHREAVIERMRDLDFYVPGNTHGEDLISPKAKANQREPLIICRFPR